VKRLCSRSLDPADEAGANKPRREGVAMGQLKDLPRAHTHADGIDERFKSAAKAALDYHAVVSSQGLERKHDDIMCSITC
jgi:hypothetical protein